MAQMSTAQLLDVALAMVGMTQAPPDSSIYHPGTRISHVLVGLDVDVAELFMARQLGYHAVLSYHAVGSKGRAWDAAEQSKGLQRAGVNNDAVRVAIEEYAGRLTRQAIQLNPNRAASVAQLLDLPFLNIQSPLAEAARRTIQATIDAALAPQPDASLAQMQDALRALPSFAIAPHSPPDPFAGWDAPAGRVVVAPFTAVPPDLAIARAYFAQGVDTLCVAGFAEDDWQTLAHGQVPGNIMILGEAPAVSVGMLPYVAELRMRGMEVTTFAGVLGDTAAINP